MANEEDRTQQLEQLLRDERALRIRAETRAAEQAEKAATWRTRAEERAARIDKLSTEPKRRRGRRTKSSKPTPEPAKRPARDATTGAASRLAAVRVAAAVQDGFAGLLAPFATTPATTPSALAEADLVVIDGPGLSQLESEAAHFSEWLRLPGRQPFLFLANPADNPKHPLVAQADLVLSDDVGHFAKAGLATMTLLPTFDPRVDNPTGRIASQIEGESSSTERNGARVLVDDAGAIVGIETADLRRPPEWLVRAAARGVPLAVAELPSSDTLELDRMATAARRWAYRYHTPTIRAGEIVRRAGIDIRDPRPHVTAVLVSMRPDNAAAVLHMLRRQTYRPLSVVVGLHGAPATSALAAAVDRAGAALSVRVMEFSKQLTLGECLNRAIEASGGEILAKIDDDDFYGPAHIEDGVHALEYSQAGIVGKGAQFTYVEAEDRTVRRRYREQETFLGGSCPGG